MVAGGKPVIIGTRKVAPNIATVLHSTDSNRPGEALVRATKETVAASTVAVNRPVKAEKFRDARQEGAPWR